MRALNTAIEVAWAVFWVYWLVSAFGAKSGSRSVTRNRPMSLIVIIAGVVLVRVFKGTDTVHSHVLEGIGTAVFVAGLALAVWARLHLGRNWGMPMTRKDEPELVTSGPYRLIRHPIYSGILLGLVGTALATHVSWLIAAAVLGVCFFYSARTEERILTDAFPDAYPGYRAHTKMLIPFVL